MKTTLVSEWKDSYGNRATIEEVFVKANKEVKQEKAYKLSCYAEYNDDFCYYVSVFETLADAETKIAEFSCGTFKNELIVKSEYIIGVLPKEYKDFFSCYKHNIAKIRKSTETNSEEKNDLIKRIKHVLVTYINNLVNLYILDYDEAKLLYEYISKIM